MKGIEMSDKIVKVDPIPAFRVTMRDAKDGGVYHQLRLTNDDGSCCWYDATPYGFTVSRQHGELERQFQERRKAC